MQDKAWKWLVLFFPNKILTVSKQSISHNYNFNLEEIKENNVCIKMTIYSTTFMSTSSMGNGNLLVVFFVVFFLYGMKIKQVDLFSTF